MKYLVPLLIINTNFIITQSIIGNLSEHKNQKITPTEFNYEENYELANTFKGSLGNFNLSYDTNYRGMGILLSQDNSGLVLILLNPYLEIKGTHLNETESLHYGNNIENKNFATYGKEKKIKEAVWHSLHQVHKLYKNNEILYSKTNLTKHIAEESNHLEKIDCAYLKTLSKKLPTSIYPDECNCELDA